ncbi:CAP domain-containing protein [Halomonas chromatireducens]|uniref:Cysteine-rich secretory protein family protein n=1 Tax=Halomonas chromatireducens TaxID=507626 RepID=A0A120JWQ8_9GAMM|nr:CAP domain-containing protein [Halomonas chromatireducens]AMD02372.1 Cysteine-rich secretory protein family protein [Halomonas chromatireducens]
MQDIKLPSALLLLLFGLTGTAMLHAGECEPDARQQAMLERVNEARSEDRQCGDDAYKATQSLAWSCRLEEAAEAHSQDMAKNEFFGHTDAEDVGVNERVNDTGYDWMAVGENIAAGQADVAEVIEGWLSSPGHCANIMSDQFTEMGAAVVEAEDSEYSPFWTQVFARPR